VLLVGVENVLVVDLDILEMIQTFLNPLPRLGLILGLKIFWLVRKRSLGQQVQRYRCHG
jgi:hypothetical protein